MSHIRCTWLSLRSLLAGVAFLMLSGCGVQVNVGDLRPPGGAMCFQIALNSIVIRATSSAPIDTAQLQLLVQSTGGTFAPVNQGFPYAEQNDSVVWGLVEGPGTYQFKIVYLNQELTSAPVTLSAQDFGVCGFKGTAKDVHFTLP